jgi:ubiquinone/menaquinone biosynthesis C-methylase UbiE
MNNSSVNFDRAASFYDATRGLPAEHQPSMIRLFAQAGDLTPDSRILEIGVGTGRIAAPLAHATGATVYGIDLSHEMMAHISAKTGGDQVVPVLGDMMRLPFAESAFDCVIAVHVFHLVGDYRAALDEVARVLRPSGRLLHGEGVGITQDVLAQAFAQISQRTAGVVHPKPEGAPEDYIEQHGWSLVRSPLKMEYTIQRSPNEFLDGIRQRLWSSTWKLNDEQHAAALREIEASIAAHYPNADHPLPLEQSFTVQAFFRG